MRRDAKTFRRSRVQWFDLGLGACAVFVSAISLFVAFRENKTQQQLLAANVWPALQYGTSNANDQLEDEISLDIENDGVGPARIEAFGLLYEGEWIKNANDVIAHLSNGRPLPSHVTSSPTTNKVLLPGKTIKFFRVKRADVDGETWDTLNEARFKVRVFACYCSILDDCWQLDSAVQSPKNVDVCTPPAHEYQG
jgi:hypothetical protein